MIAGAVSPYTYTTILCCTTVLQHTYMYMYIYMTLYMYYMYNVHVYMYIYVTSSVPLHAVQIVGNYDCTAGGGFNMANKLAQVHVHVQCIYIYEPPRHLPLVYYHTCNYRSSTEFGVCVCVCTCTTCMLLR